MSDPVIVARGLTKRFSSLTAVDELDLDVPPGQIYGFLGPNGSGKSTTIRMLCGLLTPSAGTVRVLGIDVPGDAARLKAKIGYMTQKFSLYTGLTVRENLEFVADIFTLPREARRHRIRLLEQTYELQELTDQMVGTLSGGQKQRLALAAAVVHEPELLLLDEPTSAVDPKSRRDFWESLFDLAASGTTILVSTHYMDEAERCHRLAILDRGRKVADGPPRDLMAGIGRQVVEVEGGEIETVREHLAVIDEVRSVTQLGQRLRVLLPETGADGVGTIRNALDARYADVSVRAVRPSLEDVFVTVTDRAERAGP